MGHDPIDVELVFVELGAVVVGLALLARLADRIALSPIPLYLLAGLMLGTGGIVDLDFSEEFIELAAEIGVILLLLTLGLEYTAGELRGSLRTGLRGGLLDLVFNATPGAVAGVLLGWDAKEVLVLAGVTYISSSGIVSKLLRDLGRLGNRETPSVLSLLVLEDLAMAVYLPITSVVLAGGGTGTAARSVLAALTLLAVVLYVALRRGDVVSRVLAARSNEALLLGVMGVTLLVAGVAQRMNVSAAVGAFLVGIALSGPVQQRASSLIEPLRDLFAALFFLFFGLQIDPSDLLSALPVALALAVVTALTKVYVGARNAARAGVGARGRMRAGTALIARGEFSIVIAGLGAAAGLDGAVGSLAAAYVLILAASGPIVARYADQLADLRERRAPRPA